MDPGTGDNPNVATRTPLWPVLVLIGFVAILGIGVLSQGSNDGDGDSASNDYPTIEDTDACHARGHCRIDRQNDLDRFGAIAVLNGFDCEQAKQGTFLGVDEYGPKVEIWCGVKDRDGVYERQHYFVWLEHDRASVAQ